MTAKRYNVKSEIDLSAWIEEQPDGVLVMASDYDVLATTLFAAQQAVLTEGLARAALAASVDRLTSDKARLAVDYANTVRANAEVANINCDLNERIRALEAALREARAWIEEDADALEQCHEPYDPDSEEDQEVRQEVEARRAWLHSTSETACTCRPKAALHGAHYPGCPQAETAACTGCYYPTPGEFVRRQDCPVHGPQSETKVDQSTKGE